MTNTTRIPATQNEAWGFTGSDERATPQPPGRSR
jgi:hypothetical protein